MVFMGTGASTFKKQKLPETRVLSISHGQLDQLDVPTEDFNPAVGEAAKTRRSLGAGGGIGGTTQPRFQSGTVAAPRSAGPSIGRAGQVGRGSGPG